MRAAADEEVGHGVRLVALSKRRSYADLFDLVRLGPDSENKVVGLRCSRDGGGSVGDRSYVVVRSLWQSCLIEAELEEKLGKDERGRLMEV